MPFEKVDRLRERVVDPQAAPLRKRLADWVVQQLPALKVAEPEIPQQLNDRQQDGAECLLAIADTVGGKWPSRARRALVELYTGESADDQSSATLLLSDIRDVFERLDSEVLSSVELIEQLINIDHGIWAEYHNGKPIGTRALSKLLGDFGIGPRAVRRGDQTPRGYRKESFRDAWDRYTCVPRLEDATGATLQCLCA
jgi:putative DNA primase/helicase